MRACTGDMEGTVICGMHDARWSMTLGTIAVARPPAKDSFGREVRSLRMSITQRCDLACSHCHREGQSAARTELTPGEIERVVRIASVCGVRKVKLTGGEPLMREDVTEVVSRISPLMKEVSLTTNGSRLSALAADLHRAGLARVNVSLHTLDRKRYARLCGVDLSSEVRQGITDAISAGLEPVKVNMVVLKGENADEIGPMMDFCAETGAVLQLIEYATDKTGVNGRAFEERYFPLKPFEDLLAARAVGSSMNELHRRRRYRVTAGRGEVTVEVVRPMHNTEFCQNCSRIRMSSDGRLKPCLLEKAGEVDILTPMRSGADDNEIEALFLKAVSNRRPYWR